MRYGLPAGAQSPAPDVVPRTVRAPIRAVTTNTNEVWDMRSGKLLFVVLLVALAGIQANADTTQPTITSVVVTPAVVASWDTVHVAVTATDDVGVAGVTANGIDLENTGGYLWESDVAADPAIGTHNVAVVATDAAGNTATDSTGSYRTAQVIGLRTDQAFYSPVASATDEYLFKVWGRATYRDENTFTLNDGGTITVWVTCPGHGVCNGDYVAARGILDPSVPPAKLTNVQYQIHQQAPREQMSISDVTVGKDLQDAHQGTLPYSVPLGTTLPVTIMSMDQSKVRLAKTVGGAGTASIVVYVQPGSKTIPTFYVHGLDSTGVVDMVATAPGCIGKTFKVTLTPSGFGIYTPSSVNTTTFSANTALDIRSARLYPTTLLVQSWQRVRGGITVEVPLTSSDPGVGTIVTSPIVFANGDNSVDAFFDPVGPGTTTLSVGVPDGFSTPKNNQSIVATVTAADVLGSNEIVGRDLQTTSSARLEAAPPSPVEMTVTVADPSKATVTVDPLLEGTASVKFSGVADTTNRTFYVQGRSLGSTTMSLSAPGYNTKTYTITVKPSGFAIYAPSSINTTSFSANTSLTIRSAYLNETTLAVTSYQKLRGGITADVTVTSSDPAVGTITVTPITFASNTLEVATAFDPVGPGTATISVEPPAGFSTPSNGRQITATVTAPDVLSGNETVGVDLQTTGTVHLEGAPPSPVDVTLTVADNSIATLSTSATTEGSASITFAGVNSTTSKTFYVQGRSQGTTTMSCSAPGYNTVNYTITVHPSGFYIYSPAATYRTTVFSTNTSVTIRSARLNPDTLAYSTTQAVRGGKTVEVYVTSSDPSVGVITTVPITFGANVSSVNTGFDPLAAGQTTVAVQTPSEFSTPSGNTQCIFTVDVPVINGQNETVGRDLQTTSSVSLESAPPSPVTITLTVADPTKATITADPLVEGTGSLTFTNVSSTTSKTFYVQGRGIGSTIVTASAPGYADSARTVTVDPAGFIIYSPGSITTTASAGNTTLTIRAARLDPNTLAYVTYQSVRGGRSVDVHVVSSNTAVGVITASPLTFGPNVMTVNTAFDPLSAGLTAISVEPPAGFSAPTTLRVINATVNP